MGTQRRRKTFSTQIYRGPQPEYVGMSEIRSFWKFSSILKIFIGKLPTGEIFYSVTGLPIYSLLELSKNFLEFFQVQLSEKYLEFFGGKFL